MKIGADNFEDDSILSVSKVLRFSLENEVLVIAISSLIETVRFEQGSTVCEVSLLSVSSLSCHNKSGKTCKNKKKMKKI